jgi:hypothetical protein
MEAADFSATLIPIHQYTVDGVLMILTHSRAEMSMFSFIKTLTMVRVSTYYHKKTGSVCTT